MITFSDRVSKDELDEALNEIEIAIAKEMGHQQAKLLMKSEVESGGMVLLYVATMLVVLKKSRFKKGMVGIREHLFNFIAGANESAVTNAAYPIAARLLQMANESRIKQLNAELN
jgi:hypothetical protein